MPRITNLTRDTLNFRVGRDDKGEPILESLAPQETKDLAVDFEKDAVARGQRFSAAIAVDGVSMNSDPSRTSAVPAAPARSGRTANTLSGPVPVREGNS